MWRFVMSSSSIFLILFLALPAVAQDGSGDDEEVPTFRIVGDEPPEEVTADEVDDDVDPDEIDEDLPQIVAPELVSAHVDWEFIPVIEVTSTEGAVSEVDAQRTLNDDQQGIADCFEPTSYPGEGTVTADVYLSYNGVPQAVNGSTDGVVRPNQARCVIRRAWQYEFPRMAEEADEGSRVQYRVHFVGQKIDPPSVRGNQAAHLLERVHTEQTELREQLVDGLSAQLPTAERCAATILEELPGDFVASQVQMSWRQSNGTYTPSDVDITVENKTSSNLPSEKVLDCYRRTLTNWDIDVESNDLPAQLEATFFITVEPPQTHRL